MLEQHDATPTESPQMTPVLPAAPEQKTLRSSEIFVGTREVLIAHGEEFYRLRLTRSNKLILHK